jgi:hypothetical protein
MPTLANMKVPLPKGDEEFERIAESALRLRWDLPDLVRNGRSGQGQHGVDAHVEDRDGRQLGVQFKNRLDLTIKMIRSEVADAEKFSPTLDDYYVAVGAPADARLQAEVRELNAERRSAGKFRVHMIFWDDLIQDLAKSEEEFFKHYPQLRPVAAVRYGGFTFEEMLGRLRSTRVACKHVSGGIDEELLTGLVRLAPRLADYHGVFDFVPPTSAGHLAYVHIAPALRDLGIAEYFSHHTGPMAAGVRPSFRLSADGRMFVARLTELSESVEPKS